MEKIYLDGESLQLEEVERVARCQARVEISPHALRKVQECRRYLERVIAQGSAIYGVNTGFGHLSHVRIDPQDILTLQRNLIYSHSAGVGPLFSEEEVRAIMLLRAHVLAKGYSGVRPEVIRTLVEMLNRSVIPEIPQKGSVGASGDLAPLAHLALVMIGEGEASYRGERLSGAEAMARAGIALLELQAKEGLSLINGTQVMTALGVLALLAGERLCTTADIAGALTLEAVKGTNTPFLPQIQRLRPHPGQAACAHNLMILLQDSGILLSHKYCPKIQDAYSLRCMPQVHGAARDAMAYVRKVLEVEVNAATDNPLVFPEEDLVLTGGNFHGQPVSLALDLLGMGLAELGSISERRIENLVNPTLSHLPAFLVERGGLNSGYMMLQVTAAALVSENKILASPASIDSIPTSANKEDHVSMGPIAARKAREILENVQRILAIELLCGAQGLEFSDPKQAGRGARKAYEMIRREVPPLVEDRPLYREIEACLRLVREGIIVQEIRRELGELS
ncbi:MAG: histidine ammonia-lyase [Nitrospinae bacterium]|nr:histidine ammonia-lyase [Nitrospinota bacterium]